ncbi:MAG: type I-E CRISPR-associated protein Cas7/Cse4/CasC [Deltaproteobacteria bacterium]|nr:type I-E CRISPR-associated protein Cas7/Cse4/CasC [Deltaproteobacteria bacterium]
MFVELHLLQNFAPSCLNRDDTNSPKDCEFGGYRRARISSQCIKRAIRTHFKDHLTLPMEHLALRTLRLTEELTDRFTKACKDQDQARRVAETAVKGWGLGLKDDGKTEYLLFISKGAISQLAQLCLTYWDQLAQTPAAEETEEEKGKKSKKKAAKEALPDDFIKALESILAGDKALDLALFGRMLADLPKQNIDAACQVAHAISTNQVSMEFDFYTAVDDLQPREETGAGMMGTVEFNSACFYRYANIDFTQLQQNLNQDQDLARTAVQAFLTAAVQAVPTGKQNSMAAQNPPSFVFAVAREHGLWSLANAFVDPVRPGRDGGLVQKSITALENYWRRLATAFGDDGVTETAVLAVDGEMFILKDHQVDNLQGLITKVMAALPGGRP